LNASPEDKELIKIIGADLGVRAILVEKDWLAMRLMAVLAKVKKEGFQPIFSGGTSLSKGYGLIQRFSEDLDFKMQFPAKISRAERSDYRKHIIETIRTANVEWLLEDNDILVGNQSKFFSLQVVYQSVFTPIAMLRPYLKLELSFTSPVLPCEIKSLRSFFA
jgi:predicted nucleotidyltransferase component of viral defense system